MRNGRGLRRGAGPVAAALLLATTVADAQRAPLPDLVVEDLAVSGNVVVGGSPTLRGTVRNIGNADAGASTAVFRVNVREALEVPLPPLTAAGGSTPFTVSWSPETVGPHTLTVCADTYLNALTEANETNNCATLLGVAANGAPVAEATVSVRNEAPEQRITVIAGQPTPVTLHADTDVGEAAGAAEASRDPNGWVDPPYGMATNGACSWNSDLNQGAPTFEQTLQSPGAPSACTRDLGLLTFHDPPGTYTYRVLQLTDAARLASNVGQILVDVVVAPRVLPDLSVLPSAREPIRATIGSAVVVPWKVKNVGTQAAGPTTARLCWGSATAGSCARRPARGTFRDLPVPPLDAGRTFLPEVAPLTLTADQNRTLIFCTDVRNTVRELTAANDCATVPLDVLPRPDLAPGPLAIEPLVVHVGTSVTIDAGVRNRTNAVAHASTARFCVDNPACGTTTTGRLGTDVPIGELAGFGRSARRRATWIATLGAHTVTWCADVGQVVEEGNETNNCTTAPITANTPPVAEASLSLAGSPPSASITVTRGTPVTLTARADADVTGDGSASTDPDGWTHPTLGVALGGQCAWNTNFDRQATPTFERTIPDPASPADCTTTITHTFTDPPGTTLVPLLRITDRAGAASTSAVSVAVAEPGPGAPVLPPLPPAAAAPPPPGPRSPSGIPRLTPALREVRP